jgi:hypothetical protein
LKGVFLPSSFLSNLQALGSTATAEKQAGLNFAAIELKGDNGLVNYSSKISEVQGNGIVAPNAPDASTAAALLARDGITPAAVISCFKDPVAPLSMPAAAVHYAGDHAQRWLDNSGNRWLNPYSAQAQQYIIDLAKEAVSEGFKQIYLENVEFPTDDSKAWYGDGLPTKEVELRTFVAAAAKQVEDAGGKLSVIMPGASALGQGNAQMGQDQSIYGFSADYLSPNLCPSLLGAITIGANTIAKPDLAPADTVTAAAAYLKAQSGAGLDKTVPFIQDFTNTALGAGNFKQYTVADVNAEIAALSGAGIDSFVLYAPDGIYDLSGLTVG